MGLVVGIAKAFLGDVSIDLRRREGGMPEESLHTPQICSGVEEVRGEGVSQLVWSHVEGDVGLCEVLLEQGVDRSRGEPPAKFGEKERSLGHLGCVAIGLDGLEGMGANRNQSFFGTLSQNAYAVTELVEIPHIEVGQLGES